ncbi:SMI1/KNR4 family protein [Gluconobacter kondonii]|uniref:SMI1/KNR4 family protein n=1 Tax=Gluconobacter kondonii TaxID=941463 RepID=UPI001B8C5580|nr:SMI1/KNR4 family protein [Gluconobacter kondonii]MBS1054899.1 SMI1/KNR4 family protein [Gluconobacter kondonii]
MNTLEKLVKSHKAITRPADAKGVSALQAALGFPLSAEYKEFLSHFGIIVHGAYETYGLGVPNDYYLNVLNAYKELSNDPTYPSNTVPLLDEGDGQYYLYDNKENTVILWGTPNLGVINTTNLRLNEFLIKKMFVK